MHGQHARRTVEFRGEKFTPRGSVIEMQAVLKRVHREMGEILAAFPEDAYGSGRLETAWVLLGSTVDEFERLIGEMPR